MASRRVICHRGASCPQIGLCPLGRGWGQARPREVQGGVQSSSPAGQTEQQVPAGSLCPPGEGRTPEQTAQRGALDWTPTPLPARTLILEPQGRPLLHFLRCTDRAELPWAMTSSKRGMTSSTCPARATRPTPGPGRPGPGRRHQRVPVTTTAFRGCSMAFGLRLRPAGVRTGAPYAAGARPPAPPTPRPRPWSRPARAARRAPPRPHPQLGPKCLQAPLQDRRSTQERPAPHPAEPQFSHL